MASSSRLEEIKAKVEARVAELIVPVLFERAIRVHEKHAWRHCDCDWCQRKREWHRRLQFSPLHGCPGPPLYLNMGQGDRRTLVENWRYFTVQGCRKDLADKEKEILSLPTPARKGEANG